MHFALGPDGRTKKTLLLWISAIVDWKLAQRIEAAACQAGRKGWMLVSVAVNLGILRHGRFLLEN